MKQFPFVVAFLIFGAACAFGAADPVIPRKGDVPSGGIFVPVNVDSYATHSAGVTFANKHITVGGIPFDVVDRPGADNFFLKSAQWPDWQKDPSSYYSGYDQRPETPGDPARPMFRIPVADYATVYLLAAADNDRSLSNVVTFRIGAFDGRRRATLHDFAIAVPRFDEKRPASTIAIPTEAGNVYLIGVPLKLAFGQDFKDEWALDVEVTKELHLAIHQPDPCRFTMRPLGPLSGVHIFAMTFARAAMQMEVSSDESGHVFNEPQTPMFHVRLRSLVPIPAKQAVKSSIEAVATDLDGNVTTSNSGDLTFPPDGHLNVDIPIPVKRRGYHALTLHLMSGKTEVLRRETSIALLPPDTRKHRDQSPIGTWDFSGGHFTPNEADVVGPLYVKAGLRYGMFGFTAHERKKYGVLLGSEPRSAELLAKGLEQDPLIPQHVLIFHEHAISGAHVMRTPDVFTGRSPYKLDEKEQEKFDAMFKEATETAIVVRRQFPNAQIMFGNGNPHLLEEFARHKFPGSLFDSRGNEAGSFGRMPETQPLDFVANNASIWMDRQILDAYGYSDKPITQCYEVCYPNTNPGNVSLRTQAAYFIRHIVHSLAWGVPVVRPGCICDVGNSYYFSNWGACGFCFSKPDIRPKPSYVAIATLTQQLDGAGFVRAVPTGSPVVYAVEFKKPEGGFVTVLWTIRGTRQLALDAAGVTSATLTEMTGNETAIPFADGKAQITISPDPVFLAASAPITAVTPGAPVLEARPPGKFTVICKLDKLADLHVETEHSTELEWFNFECPRRKGDFAFETVKEFEGVKFPLKVTPKLPVAGSSYLPMYSVLDLGNTTEIPGEPTEIGLMVNGNGGWGRIIFELEDAGGQRWTSIGCAMSGEPTRWMGDWMSAAELAEMKARSVADWNTNDPWQRSRINFEGWRLLKFPLPGNYPGEGYHWPFSSQWRRTGDGIVKYPLKFKKLIIELPEKTLYLKTYAPVPRPEIYLKDLQVTYQTPEKAFVAE